MHIRRIIGAHFCKVNTVKTIIQLTPLITSGNPEWKGAFPIFIKGDLRIKISK